jgi:hypothetical protein
MRQQKNDNQKNRSASLTLCGQKEHLIRGGMNSPFHSENESYRKAWRRERQDSCRCWLFLSRTHRDALAAKGDRYRVHSSGSRDKMSESGDCSDAASDVWLTEGAV